MTTLSLGAQTIVERPVAFATRVELVGMPVEERWYLTYLAPKDETVAGHRQLSTPTVRFDRALPCCGSPEDSFSSEAGALLCFGCNEERRGSNLRKPAAPVSSFTRDELTAEVRRSLAAAPPLEAIVLELELVEELFAISEELYECASTQPKFAPVDFSELTAP